MMFIITLISSIGSLGLARGMHCLMATALATAPIVCCDLPDVFHSAATLACFRKGLQLYLFKKAFPT